MFDKSLAKKPALEPSERAKMARFIDRQSEAEIVLFRRVAP
jgi:hypothetical protein